jgi:aromatic-amino-acid transaminase
VAISDPSWENHRALFETAGFPVQNYRYYDAATHDVNRTGMLEDLNALPNGSIIVLHACCHNPTGVDLSPADWKNVLEVVKAKGHVPFLDMAYQGFGDGIDEDAAAVRLFAESGLTFFASSSFSKSFSLYGERVGALSIVSESKEESARVLSQVKRVIRTNYSNPPTHGASVVAAVLNSPELRAQWEAELAEMRLRIRGMRTQMVDLLAQKAPQRDFSFVGRQCGMFSYSGLTVEQVHRLRNEFGIYALDTGRICVAALNQSNIKVVTDAIVQVI